jgi:hypothetical protein
MKNGFNIICNNEYEFITVQKYLFKENYEWIEKGKYLYVKSVVYPIIIKNVSSVLGYLGTKLVWRRSTDKTAQIYYFEDIIKKIRKEKLLKIKEINEIKRV